MKTVGGWLTTIFVRPAVAQTGGEVNWTSEIGEWVVSSPTVIDDTVFIGSDTGNVYALDATTGEEVWNFETDENVNSSPAVIDGTVFVGSLDGNLYALDAETGDQQWVLETDAGIWSSPTVVDSTVFVGAWEGQYAIDAVSGEEQWLFETDSQISSSPIVVDDSVYFGSERGMVYALNKNTGDEEWNLEGAGEVIGVTISEDALFATTSISEWDEETDELENEEGHIYRIDIASGDIVWETNVESTIGSTPTVSNGVLVTGLRTDTAAFDIDTGEQIWEFPSISTVRSPTIVGDRVYTAGNNIRGFDLSTGELEWEHEVGGGTGSSPIVIDGTIFIVFGGDLYSVETGTDGSSNGSRAEAGTLGHHNDWQQDGQSTGGGGAVHRQISESANNPVVLVGGGVATAGVGYFAYQKFKGDNDSASTEVRLSGSSREESLASSESKPNIQLTINEYDDLNLETTVKHYSNIQVDRATTQNEAVWVVTPDSDKDTISTDLIENFLDRVDPWTNMEDHANLLSIYGHGSDPLPWVAIEPADHPTLLNRAVGLSTKEKLQLLTEVCEGVHHVQRYGLAYKYLSPDSVLVDDTTVILRGVLDHVSVEKVGYELPNQKEDSSTEQAEVYRLGALAYELFTGSRPTQSNPTPPSKRNSTLSDSLDKVLLTALAEIPADRYETVLHFRDELKECSEDL